MSNKERIPVSFWLKDKTVTGLLLADHAGKKLVSYSGKYFVVSDKTPEKRHYTESTLPASWKKIIAGEPPPSPTSPKGGNTTPVATGKTKPLPVEPDKALLTPRQLDIPADPAVRARKERRDEAPAEATKAPKTASNASVKRASVKRSAAKGQTAAQTVQYFCPYCSTEHSCNADKAGAPFFQQCSKCGKEFGVKITATLVYQAEVAGFK